MAAGPHRVRFKSSPAGKLFLARVGSLSRSDAGWSEPASLNGEKTAQIKSGSRAEKGSISSAHNRRASLIRRHTVSHRLRNVSEKASQWSTGLPRCRSNGSDAVARATRESPLPRGPRKKGARAPRGRQLSRRGRDGGRRGRGSGARGPVRGSGGTAARPRRVPEGCRGCAGLVRQTPRGRGGRAGRPDATSRARARCKRVS